MGLISLAKMTKVGVEDETKADVIFTQQQKFENILKKMKLSENHSSWREKVWGANLNIDFNLQVDSSFSIACV